MWTSKRARVQLNYNVHGTIFIGTVLKEMLLRANETEN